MKNLTLTSILILFVGSIVSAKLTNGSPLPVWQLSFAQTNPKTKVYLECTQTWLCDYDYLRTQLSMVDFVRDRFMADVHVQVNTQFTSSDSEQNTIVFKGQNAFLNQDDTLIRVVTK